jgi:putative ABC transport system substrate-binding protein
MRRIGLAVVLAVSTLLAPLAMEAQAPSKAARVGYLSIGSASDPRRIALLAAFRQGLSDLNYLDGKNISIDARFAGDGYARLPELASELVRLNVDILVAYATPAALAARNATKTIPIVITGVVDPVATGLVPVLGRPGGNVTGLSLMAPEIIGKQMQLIKEIIPKLSRVAVLWNPANASNRPQLREAEIAAQTLGVRLQPLEAREPDNLERAFASMTRERPGAVIVVADGVFIDNRARIARLAEAARVPAVYGLREHAEAGGLMFYGANPGDLNRRAATYVDKLLKGAKPADLPVEQPTKFELVINLKTAKALGLTIPQSILVRADEIIQ